LGFAGGNNVAIKYAMRQGYAYVWLLNNDTVVEAETLTELVKTAINDPLVAMVGSKICYYTSPQTIQMAGGGRLLTLLGTSKNCGIGKEDGKEMDGKPEEPDYIGGASLLTSMEMIRQIGLMDESYFMYLEDLEWGVRARKRGFRMAYCSRSRLWHKGGASCKGFHEGKFLWKQKTRPTLNRFLMDWYGYRNWVYLYKKYFPYLMPLLFCRLLYKAVEILMYDDHKFMRERMLFRAIWNGLSEKSMGKLTIEKPNK